MININNTIERMINRLINILEEKISEGQFSLGIMRFTNSESIGYSPINKAGIPEYNRDKTSVYIECRKLPFLLNGKNVYETSDNIFTVDIFNETPNVSVNNHELFIVNINYNNIKSICLFED